MMQPMIDTPFAIRNLFTFGQLQLQECLHEVNKAKFPFPQSAKIKKNPLLHKLVSQQRQKTKINAENNNMLNLPLGLNPRVRAMSQENKGLKNLVQQQSKPGEAMKNKSNQTRHRKKNSLPKIIKNVFPDCGMRRKITSASASTRYNQQASTELRGSETENQSVFQELRPRSVMLLSEICSQIPEEKVKTIQHQRNRIYSRACKSKQEQKGRVMAVNSRIIENINEFKKIYC